MKKDKLLNQFRQKGLKAKESNKSSLDTFKKKKNVTPIDSGTLISLKGGNSPGDPPPRIHLNIGN